MFGNNPEHTVFTKSVEGVSVTNQICQSSFLFVPANNHIFQHVKSVDDAKLAIPLRFEI